MGREITSCGGEFALGESDKMVRKNLDLQDRRKGFQQHAERVFKDEKSIAKKR